MSLRVPDKNTSQGVDEGSIPNPSPASGGLRATPKTIIKTDQISRLDLPDEFPKLPSKIKEIDTELQDYEKFTIEWYQDLVEVLEDHVDKVVRRLDAMERRLTELEAQP